MNFVNINGTDKYILCYLMKDINANNYIWDNNIGINNNGALTMGIIICTLAHYCIRNITPGNIKIIGTGICNNFYDIYSIIYSCSCEL